MSKDAIPNTFISSAGLEADVDLGSVDELATGVTLLVVAVGFPVGLLTGLLVVDTGLQVPKGRATCLQFVEASHLDDEQLFPTRVVPGGHSMHATGGFGSCAQIRLALAALHFRQSPPPVTTYLQLVETSHLESVQLVPTRIVPGVQRRHAAGGFVSFAQRLLTLAALHCAKAFSNNKARRNMKFSHRHHEYENQPPPPAVSPRSLKNGGFIIFNWNAMLF